MLTLYETDTFWQCCKRRIYGIIMEISKSPAGDASDVQVFLGGGVLHVVTLRRIVRLQKKLKI